eukprot:g45292.t1
MWSLVSDEFVQNLEFILSSREGMASCMADRFCSLAAGTGDVTQSRRVDRHFAGCSQPRKTAAWLLMLPAGSEEVQHFVHVTAGGGHFRDCRKGRPLLQLELVYGPWQSEGAQFRVNHIAVGLESHKGQT